ncbi:MAG TPA: class I adenylate-forming enzyme family protein [Xanthobacteraceae bacterium]|nr:class I adenylate-forming enzyme family protein [Xanthobacteraceae bacterium]
MIETITQALARQARERPAALALLDDRVRLGWGEVAAWVARAAGWLRTLDLPRGATVLGWLPNGAEWYLLRLACEQAGLFWVPVSAGQGRRELTSIAARARPRVLISRGHFRDRDYAAEADEVCAQLALRPLRIAVPDDGLLRLDGPHDDGGAALRLDEAAHALPTSGSAGIPKLAIYTLAAACERAHAQARLLSMRASDIVLVLSHGTGPAKPAWLAAPIAGSPVIGMPVFSADAALNLIAREHPTIVCGTPAQLVMLAKNLGGIDCASVRIWYTAGSVLPPTLAGELEATTRGIVLSTYGGADFGGWAAVEPSDGAAVRHRTVGKPRGGTEFRIVDGTGGDLAAGQTGELIGRGPCCVAGYLGEPGREQWRDGWFHSGDLAAFDADGNIVIKGRMTEVITRGGDKISATEVEALLRTHPAVAQVAVIGVPDPVLGERICACIVPALRRNVDLDMLRQHLHNHGLASYKAPEQIVILDDLPIIGDKIDRRALTDRVPMR